MEYLARVRDGSTGEIGNGYSACLAVACESGGRRITPLHMRLWSSEAEGFISQNDEVLGVIDQIDSRAKKRGIYVIDRGGDGDWLFDGLTGANWTTSCASWATATRSTAGGPRWPKNWRHPAP